MFKGRVTKVYAIGIRACEPHVFDIIIKRHRQRLRVEPLHGMNHYINEPLLTNPDPTKNIKERKTNQIIMQKQKNKKQRFAYIDPGTVSELGILHPDVAFSHILF